MNNDILNKCIKILKTSKSDNELLAALLMVTKVTKAEDCDENSMKRIFDAISSKFLYRLLRTGSEKKSKDISGLTFQSVAVNVMSSFCCVPRVMDDPGFTALLPHVAALTAKRNVDDETSPLIADSYDCLTRMASAPSGPLVLVESGCVSHICQAIINKCIYNERGFELLVHLCNTCGSHIWSNSCDDFEPLIRHLTKETELDQTEKKFNLCSDIATIVASAPEEELNKPDYLTWRQTLGKLLFNILRNKLGAKQRLPVLRLCSSIIDQCGVQWTLLTDPKFLLLLVHMACIEIRMALDTEDLQKISLSGDLLVICYTLVEHVIEYMTAGPSLQLNSTQVTQLHSAMVGAFNAVIHFLDRIADHPHCQSIMPLVIASVRVLGSWIAEETSALREEVIKLLPFLIQTGCDSLHWCQRTKDIATSVQQESPKEISADPPNHPATESETNPMPAGDDSETIDSEDITSKSSLDQNSTMILSSSTPVTNMDLKLFSSIEVLQFLMPGFCHLSAEDVPRKVMLSSDLPQLLSEYLRYQFTRLQNTGGPGTNKEPGVALVTMCGVIMNIVVMEADLTSSHPVFAEILQTVMTKLVEIQDKFSSDKILLYNLMVVGLMILRNQSQENGPPESSMENFLRCCVDLLMHAHTAKSDSTGGNTIQYQDQWQDTAEYWALAMQVLTVCINQLSCLPNIILTAGYLPKTCRLLLSVNAKDVPIELQNAYGELLQAMIKADPSATNVIMDAGGTELSGKYKQMNLEFLAK